MKESVGIYMDAIGHAIKDGFKIADAKFQGQTWQDFEEQSLGKK